MKLSAQKILTGLSVVWVLFIAWVVVVGAIVNSPKHINIGAGIAFWLIIGGLVLAVLLLLRARAGRVNDAAAGPRAARRTPNSQTGPPVR